jgi:hypothetical protein
VGDQESESFSLRDAETFYMVHGNTSENGILEMEFMAHGKFAKPDTRNLYAGLSYLAYCQSGDLSTRITLIEAITLASLSSLVR